MTDRRARAEALEAWAEQVDPGDLVRIDSDELRHIAALVGQREQIDRELAYEVQAARAAKRSWSEIGAVLGVSKQAAQHKYRDRTA
jgi:hypothetical protein